MAEIIRLNDGARIDPPPPVVKRIVVITPAQDKLFYFVTGVFVGAHWIAAMAAFIRWLNGAPI